MKKVTDNWLKIAAKDLKMAKVSLRENEPLSVIYHLHASVEKILKAILEEHDIVPPKIHSLKILAVEAAQVSIEQHQLSLLNLLDKAFISSKYPDEVEKFEEEFDIERCQGLVKDTEVIIKWLKDILEKN